MIEKESITLNRLFDIISANYLGSMSNNCKYEKITGTFQIGSEIFTCKGIQIKSAGFSEVMPWTLKKDIILPAMAKGEKYKVDSLIVKKGQTTPPELLSESELITKMDANGIGTDASIPTHIQNIIDRGYVIVQSNKRRLAPTGFGIALVRSYHDVDKELVLPAVRANIEKMVDEIAKGKSKYEDILTKSIDLFRSKYDNFVKNIGKLDIHFNEQIKCNGFSMKGDNIREEPISLSVCKKCYYGRLLLYVRRMYVKCDSCDFNVFMLSDVCQCQSKFNDIMS